MNFKEIKQLLRALVKFTMFAAMVVSIAIQHHRHPETPHWQQSIMIVIAFVTFFSAYSELD